MDEFVIGDLIFQIVMFAILILMVIAVIWIARTIPRLIAQRQSQLNKMEKKLDELGEQLKKNQYK
ncbi:DUF4083 family protein [Priestia filamentosa]|uniref:DUF4083 family protein n=1 Tax=Priestia filamentosa TaxID=1402861 RepID=UPI003982BA9A